ncbi:MAG: 1-phosphofructokinase [Clostridia bacterium]|nr:1-phosphofructokinase [Clostridia bacterium]
MVYTLTFNPALDYAVELDAFSEGGLNRSNNEYISYGGKGINVSVVLTNLKIENTALGFLAGFTGRELDKSLKEQGIKTDFVYLKSGFTRINVKIKSQSETEINANGPQIDKASLDKLFRKLNSIKSGDYLILSGSIPKNLSQNIYKEILEMLADRGVEFVVDAEKGLLLDTLRFKPFLVKPNLFELQQITGKRLENETEIIDAAKALQKQGSKNVLVSLGEKGALLISEKQEVFRQKAPDGRLVNSVGAGDSMISGFLKGYFETKDYEKALKFGVAAGSATAFSRSLAKKEEIYGILEKLD